jgi:hypothetical protein
MEVLPTHAVYGTGRMTAESVAAAKASWHSRLERLFEEAPIPFRSQNGGSYPDGHVLARHVAVGQSGLPAHVEDVLVEGVPVEDVPVEDVALQALRVPISALDPATR